MSDCCGKPQIYAWNVAGQGPYDDREPSQYCGDARLFRYRPPVEGNAESGQFVTNEQDWIDLTYIPPYYYTGVQHGYGLAIRSDGTLWTWGESPINDVQWLLDGTYGFDYGLRQIGTDTDWVKCSGGLLLKQNGTLWSIGSNANGALGLGVAGSSVWRGYFTSEVYAVMSSPIASASLYGNPTFSSKPTLWLAAMSRSGYDNGSTLEGGYGAAFDCEWGGAIDSIQVTSSGSGYTFVPEVTISASTPADAGVKAKAKVTGMTFSKTRRFSVKSGGSGYTWATARDSRTGATAVAFLNESGAIIDWAITSEGNAYANPLYPSSVTIFGDGNGATAESVPYPSGVTQITVTDNPYEWTATPIVSIEGNATAIASGISGPIKSVSVVASGSGYSTTDLGDSTGGCRDRALFVMGSDGVTESAVATVALAPSPVSSLAYNFSPSFSLPAGNVVSVYFNRNGTHSATGWFSFDGTSHAGGLAYGGDGYTSEPPAYVVYNGVALPQQVSGGQWISIDGFGLMAVDQSGDLWWWGSGRSTYPTRVGQSVAVSVTSPTELDGQFGGFLTGTESGRMLGVPLIGLPLVFSDPDSPSGAKPSGSLLGFTSHDYYTASSASYSGWKTKFTTATISSPGVGYTSIPNVYADGANVPLSATLVGPSKFTAVHRGMARDVSGRWWSAGVWSRGSDLQVSGVMSKTTYADGNAEFVSDLAIAKRGSMKALVPVNPGSGYSTPITISYKYTSGSSSWVTSYQSLGGVSKETTYCTVQSEVKSTSITVPPSYSGTITDFAVFATDISDAAVSSSTGSGATVRVVDVPYRDDPVWFTPTLDAGYGWSCRPGYMYSELTAGSSAPSWWDGANYWAPSSAAFSGDVTQAHRASGFRDPDLAACVAFDDRWTLTSDGRLRAGGRFDIYSWQPVGNHSQVSLSLTSTGGGYTDPVHVELSRPPGVARATAHINGQVISVGVLDGGSGYRTPPSVSIAGGASAQAVIQGPVDSITVTNQGGGYRLPPIVRFSQPGVPAKAECILTADGKISHVIIPDGGKYRAAPSVWFEPIPDVESIEVTSGGSGYTSPPEVLIVGHGGGGSGATARCTISGGSVSEVIIASRGSGYYDTPKVLFIGGGGTGATAEATVAAAGSGATATATINGSVIFARVVNPGSGYQSAPAVSVAGNASLQARIAGPIDSITIDDGGGLYGFSRWDSPPPSPAYLSKADDATGTSYCTATSSAGMVSSISPPNASFFNAPQICFPDTTAVLADTVLTRRNVSVIGSQPKPNATSADVNHAGGYGLDGMNLHVMPVGPIGGFNNVGYHGYSLAYSVLPQVYVEDVAGSGFAATPVLSGGRLSGISISSPGSGYTVYSKLALYGGRRWVWDNEATATATINNLGELTAITVTNAGSGYTSPRVIISGGGGSGATAQVVSFSYAPVGYGVFAIGVRNGGSGYKEPPVVTIVESSDWDPSSISKCDVFLSSALPEYAWQDVPQQRTLSGPEWLGSPYGDWQFIPHYTDGYVEYLYLDPQRYSGLRTYSSAPLVSISGPGGSGASGQASLVKWTGIFCDGAAKRWTDTTS